MPELIATNEALELTGEGKFLDRSGAIVDTSDWAEENRPYLGVDELESSVLNLDWVPAEPDFDLTISDAPRWPFRLPETVLWDDYQTPIRNQDSRNTCSAFCMVAAIEARYKRDHGLDLDLSEQFFWHLYKSSSLDHPRKYQYENQSSFWGGGNSWGLRSAVNFVICEEAYAPYRSKAEMEALRDSIPGTGNLAWSHIPEENTNTQAQVDAFEYSTRYITDRARAAARYGVASYELLDGAKASDPSHLEKVIASGHEVLLDVVLNWKSDENGVMQYDPEVDNGAHCFLLVGYDRPGEYFYVKNSWGGSAYTKVGYSLIRNASFHGSYITSVREPGAVVHGGRYIGRWEMDHDGWEGEVVIRRWPVPGEGIQRLGHYIRNGRSKAINGRTTSNSQTIVFSIEDEEHGDPNVMTGQQFTTSIYSRRVDIAAGSTKWSNIPFGVQMLRSQLTSPVRPENNTFEADDWVGTWVMNHDGWVGQLTISGVGAPRHGIRPVAASYRDLAGNRRLCKGALYGKLSHALQLQISFPGADPQRFSLYVHTHDTVRFSGSTRWNGRTFGVVGVRSR